MEGHGIMVIMGILVMLALDTWIKNKVTRNIGNVRNINNVDFSSSSKSEGHGLRVILGILVTLALIPLI